MKKRLLEVLMFLKKAINIKRYIELLDLLRIALIISAFLIAMLTFFLDQSQLVVTVSIKLLIMGVILKALYIVAPCKSYLYEQRKKMITTYFLLTTEQKLYGEY